MRRKILAKKGVAIAKSSLSDDDGSGGLEGGLKALVRSSLDWLNLGELYGNLGVSDGVRSQELVWLNDACLDDLDGLMGSSVSSAHFHV